MMLKIIQLINVQDHTSTTTLALCDDGTVWALNFGGMENVDASRWVRLPLIPAVDNIAGSRDSLAVDDEDAA
jgi:hypothetical protein